MTRALLRLAPPSWTMFVIGMNASSGESLAEVRVGDYGGLAGHSSRVEAYAVVAGTLQALSPLGSRALASPGCNPASADTVSANGSRLVLWCLGMPAPLVVYDLEEQVAVLRRPDWSGHPTALSPDGRALYLFEDPPRALLRKYDVDSGVMLAEREMARSGRLYADPFTGNVLVVGASCQNWAEDSTLMLDPDTLETIASIGPEIGSCWSFDSERPRAFVVATIRESWGVYRNFLNVIDTRTLAITASGELPTRLRPLGLVLIPRPSAPVGFSAAVTGNLVLLDWAKGPRGLPLNYRIDAGSSPGASNLAVFDTAGPETSVEVHGVPAGRYFVRVRGVNANGPGLPSAEIVVDVGTASPE